MTHAPPLVTAAGLEEALCQARAGKGKAKEEEGQQEDAKVPINALIHCDVSLLCITHNHTPTSMRLPIPHALAQPKVLLCCFVLLWGLLHPKLLIFFFLFF